MLTILTTHPIQYQVPIWRELAQQNQIDFEVWYLSDHGARQTLDPGFGQSFQWDLEMLKGYPYRFLATQPKAANINSFRGARVDSLEPLFRERQVTALWINGWQVQAYWQAAFQAHRLGIPVWLRAESNDLRQSHWLKRLPRRTLLSQLFKCITYFLYIGTANRRFYKQYGVPNDKLVPAPYCVDNQRFILAAQELSDKRTILRQNWNIPETAICFLFCGKFVPKKRPFDLLEAVTQLVVKQPRFGSEGKLHVLMVGDGEMREELKRKACQLESLCGRPVVTFTGFLNQTEIPKVYMAADCLVLPSDAGETWGLVVNEALACGRPAIVSDLCGCAEDLARPLSNNFVYGCGNVSQLARKLQHSIEHPNELINYHHYVEHINRFNLNRTVASVEQIYLPISRKNLQNATRLHHNWWSKM